MAYSTSRREVRLIDARRPERPLVDAELYRDFPAAELDIIESVWHEARKRAVAAGIGAGLTPLEHLHWDWRNKIDSVEEGKHLLLALECEGEVQGLAAILTAPRRSRFTGEAAAYVDYLESAPWNLKGPLTSPRFIGVGTLLIAEVVRLSLETGLDGRVGLHSLPQAESFYESRCRMTNFGEDPGYYDLTDFEFVGQDAIEWLASIGEIP